MEPPAIFTDMKPHRTVAELKRTAYVLALLLGTGSMVIELVFGSPTQSISYAIVTFDRLVFSAVIGVAVWVVWAMYTGRITIHHMERPLALFSAVYFLAKFGLALFVGDGPVSLAFAESWYWMLLATWTFGLLAYDLKRALVQNTVVSIIALILHMASAGMKSSVPGLLQQLPDIAASHLRLGATTAILSILGYTKQQWVRVEREAIALRHLAHIDPLTNLPNRRQLNKVLSETHELYPGLVTLIMFDIDSFKQINDEHGHLIGDRILQEMSQLAQAVVRSQDLLGRWGGEEFLVVCPHTRLGEGLAIAERIRKAMAAHEFPYVGTVTASFGVAQHRPGESTDQLISRADVSLYQAKADGKDRIQVAG